MKFDSILVIDNLLEEKLANRVSQELLDNKTWSCNWRTIPSRFTEDPKQWHWHRSIWNDKSNMPELQEGEMIGHPNISLLWEEASRALLDRFGFAFLPVRAYANAHTYGVDGAMHTDDGDITVIYYSSPNWKIEWEGGTALYNEAADDCIKYCSYKFNRLFAFPAAINHKPMPVTKECKDIRTVIVFKTIVDINHETYSKAYYEGRIANE
jgi:SM-20-related protein